MIVPRVLAWAFFTLWVTWAFALQARLASGGGFGAWTPDAGLVLALSVLARAEARHAPLLAVLMALSRSALGAEPAVALLSGSLGVILLALASRSMVELTGPAWRAAAAGACVLAFDLWLMTVHRVRARDLALPLAPEALAAIPNAVASALLALVLGPALAHLPGLTPLRRRRW